MADPLVLTDHWDTLRWSLERSKCERDFEYLSRTYLRIKSKTQIGLPTLRFNAVQRHLHETCEDQLKRTGYIRKIYGKSRQVGSSTYFQARTFHQTAFHDHRNALFLAHDEPSSIEIFGVTKAYYDALPIALKPRTKYDARQKIEFIGRNSKIISAHAANINVAAGQMYHIVHLTEAARYPNPEKVQASLFPSISEARGDDHSLVVIESTSVFGGTWFKDLADAAARGDNEYEFHFVPWFHHDAYVAAVPADFETTHEEREWKRQYGLTNNQIAWWRQMANKYASNPAIVRSEFPFDWESSWQLPVGTLRVFTDHMLLDMARGVRPADYRALPTSAGLEKVLGGPVEVWETPQPGVFYHAGIDLSEGRTERADWSVGCVVRRDTLAQVAQFRVHENPASTDFLDLVYWLGMAYNSAEINPDITGGWGNALLTELQYRNYPNIWRWRRRDDAKQRVSSRIGFLFTKRDKAHLVGNAVALATRGEVAVASETLLDEMRVYLNIGLDEWSAAPGQYDDCTTAWMLALLAARDERSSSGQALPPEEPVIAKPAHAWHNVDADLEDEETTALIRMDPWKG